MKQNINIEAEGSELILRNKVGDYVIIPKKHRTEVLSMIDENQHERIDALVGTLPVMEDYADDGSLIPRNQVTQKKGRTVIFAEEPPMPVEEMISFGMTPKKDGSVFDEDIAELYKERIGLEQRWFDGDRKNVMPNNIIIAHGENITTLNLNTQDPVRDYVLDKKKIENQNKISAINAKIEDIYKKKGYPNNTDKTFKIEAERGAEYYKRNNIPYEIVSFYGDKQKIVDSLSGDDISDIVLMGHHGRKVAGIHLDEWNDIIKNAKYDRCILGSCWGNHLVRHLKDVKNLHHTDGIQWEGVNPKANKSEDFYFPKGYQITTPK